MAIVSSKQVQIVSGGCGDGFKLGYNVNSLLKKDLSSHERAAILKARFAETIAKMNAGNYGKQEDPQTSEQTLERKRRLGEAKMKVLIRKEELKQEADLKRKRSEERDAARKRLEIVEKTAEIEDNFQVMRELVELMRGGESAWADLRLRLVEKEEEDGHWRVSDCGLRRR